MTERKPRDSDPPALAGLDIALLNVEMEPWSTEAILRWAWETLGPAVAASSSFQTQSAPLLYLIGQVCPAMPVIFLDTGFHFPETLAYRDELQARLGLNIVTARQAVEQSQLLQQYGEGLYRRDPDLCCYIHKVEPMQRATAGLRGWVNGVRRDQTANRGVLRTLEAQPDGLLKIHPMLNWTKRDVWAFIERHDLPVHPLLSKGYPSIGCAPCTRPVAPGEDDRAGRWAGTDKTECGLHVRQNLTERENGKQPEQ